MQSELEKATPAFKFPERSTMRCSPPTSWDPWAVLRSTNDMWVPAEVDNWLLMTSDVSQRRPAVPPRMDRHASLLFSNIPAWWRAPDVLRLRDGH
jgi:hypothetical protein